MAPPVGSTQTRVTRSLARLDARCGLCRNRANGSQRTIRYRGNYVRLCWGCARGLRQVRHE